MKSVFEVYMIPRSFPKWREYSFISWNFLEKMDFLTFSRFNYRKVYEGNYDGKTLDGIYVMLNSNHPEDYKYRSLSMSDVVVIKKDCNERVYYVDDCGFKDITDIWQKEKLTAEDFEEIKYQGSEYCSHTSEHVFTTEIHGLPVRLVCEISKGDEDEYYTFYSDETEVWETLSADDKEALETRLENEMRVGRYEKKFEECISLDELNEVQYEFMEDESFPRCMNVRFWDGYNRKKDILSKSA